MKILVWDIPTRLFHWLFAAAFAAAYITGETETLFPVHVFSGLLMVVLVVFRLAWGIVGSRYARFSSFLFSPAEAGRYLLAMLKGQAKHFVGHNPAGSWAIYALLLLGVTAPLAGLATLVSGEAFEEIHEVLANALLIVAILHVLGVALGSWAHKENLPRTMVTGLKEGETVQGIPSARPIGALVLALLLAASGAVFLKGYDAGQQSLSLPFLSQPVKLVHEEHKHEHGDHEHEENE